MCPPPGLYSWSCASQVALRSSRMTSSRESHVHAQLNSQLRKDFIPYLIHRLVGVDGGDHVRALRAIVVQDGLGFVVVLLKPLLQFVGGVIAALHQRLTCLVVLHGFWHGLAVGSDLHGLGFLVQDMVRPARLLMDPPAGDPGLEDRIW